jgi:zinc D-Ala-D-Ala carboxypeptidase
VLGPGVIAAAAVGLGLAAWAFTRGTNPPPPAALVSWSDAIPGAGGLTYGDLAITSRTDAGDRGERPDAQLVVNLARVGQELAAPAVGLGAVVTSGWRWPALNEAVQGSPTSLHLQGLAVDLRPPRGETASQLLASLQALGVQWRDAIVYAPANGGHLHLDLPDAGQPYRNTIKALNTSISASYPVFRTAADAGDYAAGLDVRTSTA